MDLDKNKKNIERKGYKTREERIIDSVKLLKRLKEVGADKDIGYIELKKVLDQWIEDGHSFVGKIYLPRYGRYIDLFLPWRKGVEPVSILKTFIQKDEEDYE